MKLSGIRHQAAIALLGAIVITACSKQSDEQAASTEVRQNQHTEVNVYSGRHYDSDLVLFDAFTKETGVQVNLIEAGGDALIERISREADASPADIFMTADAGILWRADERGVFREIKDPSILERVAAHYRHPEGKWIGLSRRARIVIYNKEMGLPVGLETYMDLANPAYRDMICVRSSSNVYNQSLLASIIAHHGEEAAEQWARGVVANFARKPQGNDTAQIEAVAAGICRLGIVNTYYVARYVDPDDETKRSIGENVGVLFPNQETTGAHVNISGAGVTAHAPNAENAEALIAFLLRDDIQQAFAKGNNEYPIVEGIAPAGPVATLGHFGADTLDAALLGENQVAAVMIFDRAGWF